MRCAVQVKPAEMDIFLKGGGALDINSVRKKPKVSHASLEIVHVSASNPVPVVLLR